MLQDDIKNIVQDVLTEYAPIIMQESNSKVTQWKNEIVSSSGYSVEDSMIKTWYDSEFASYLTFGTGRFASAYLSDKPKDIKEEAQKFYVNGQGRQPAQPFYYETLLKYQEEISKVIDSRIQDYFNRLQF
mgnify:CR=1 FL=1